MKADLRLLSLFSGCGGLDLGFEGAFDIISQSHNSKINVDWSITEGSKAGWIHLPKTRFSTVFANDIRPGAQALWNHYFDKQDTYRLGSIVDIVKAYRAGDINVFPDGVDIVTGGFPCQDFSLAGKRLGFESSKSHDGRNMDTDAPSIESRGQLYMWLRSVIEITLPKVFVAENVKGLVSLADVKQVIEDDFRSISGGYLVVPARVLHAADYGVSQSRERVIFIGFKRSELNAEALTELSQDIISDKYSPYPQQTHAYTVDSIDLLPPVTVRQAFIGLDEPIVSSDIAQRKYSNNKYMGKHCQGQSEINMDSIAPTIRSEHHGNIEFRRLSAEHGGKYIDELSAGLSERRLTVRECARIQTFPDDYEFVLTSGKHRVSVSEAYKVIGNAVPPLLGYHIAKRLEKNWELYFKGQ